MDYMDDDFIGDFGYLDHLANGGAESEDLHMILDDWLESGSITQDEYDSYSGLY